MKWGLFLLLAVISVVLFLGVGGGWLLPRLGVDAAAARIIGAALAGVAIAILYFRMIRGTAGA
jgi:hypothetical protein